MKILNYGSLNLDYVYSLDHIVKKGETIASSARETFCGGKGLNQSVALAKAGAEVYHAGAVGREDGSMLIDMLKSVDVDVSHTRLKDALSGHAVIQRDKDGDNSIILYQGANILITREEIDETLNEFSKGDYLILQNEISELEYIIESARAKGMIIVLNPSPMNEIIFKLNLTKLDYIILNEIEAGDILKEKFSIDSSLLSARDILRTLGEHFENLKIVLTLGEDGCLYNEGGNMIYQPIYRVDVLDTTAAGDSFTGFFIASVAEGKDVHTALKIASRASSIAVSRAGAAPSIPSMEEVLESL